MMKIDRAFCVCFVTLVCASLAHANNDEWNDPTGGNWSDYTNWSNGNAPHVSDQASFDKAGTYRVSYDEVTQTIQDLFVSGGGNVTLDSIYGAPLLNVNSVGGGQNVVVADGATFTLGYAGAVTHALTLNAGATLYVQTGGTLNVFQGSTVTATTL
ncbi:MAG TPA: hypothetical protein VHU84_03700, partial [Lacipirellulaceae bacterium]|nr:hypothetical protein [Lacipirellulaceae bacterium]